MLYLVMVAACGAVTSGAAERPAAGHSGEFAVSGLRCVIGDNEALGEHREGYNGVFAITAPDAADSPFVPLYAGLNLEHYFDTRPRPADAAVFFEPRRVPMTFTRIDERTAELYQPPTPVFGVESWTRFEVREPHYIDMQFRCVPRKDAFQGGLMGVFWASYIHAPEDKSMYFLGGVPPYDAPRWTQLCTPAHDHDSTVRHVNDERVFPFETAGGTLYSSFSPLRFDAPFFYGRVRGHVLIYIFDPAAIVRFAHSPSGGGVTPGGDDTSPAWDFQLIVPEPKVGQEYTLRMRLVYKPWVSRDDVLDEARRYREFIGVN